MEHTLRAIFSAIDAFDVDSFLGFLAPEAKFTLGNLPPACGAAEIRQAFTGFASSLTHLQHEIVDIWITKDAWIVEQRVTYGDPWHRLHILPCTNVMRHRDGLITDYRVFVDVSPLFIPPVAAAQATA